MLPDFLGIGAQRAGTNWITYNLRRCPDIYITPIKEIHYFDRSSKYSSPNLPDNISTRAFGKNGWWRIQFKKFCKAKSLKRKIWYFKYLFGNYSDKWYASLFNYGKGKICGEITPAYSMLEPEDICKIYELMPSVKIIYVMRNPIDRAWSGFKHKASIEKRQLHSYSDEEIKRCLGGSDSRLRGDYLRTLDNWQKFFPKKQFFIGYFDEIINSPKDLILKLLSFLELRNPETYFEKIYEGEIHASVKVKLPKKYREYLIKIYYPEIVELSKRFSSYPSSWLKEIESNI